MCNTLEHSKVLCLQYNHQGDESQVWIDLGITMRGCVGNAQPIKFVFEAIVSLNHFNLVKGMASSKPRESSGDVFCCLRKGTTQTACVLKMR